MQISVISASHRRKSESARIAEIISLRLIQINNNIKLHNLCLANSEIPLWTPAKGDKNCTWNEKWLKISLSLQTSSAFVLVVPEYGGMATPQAKNLFLLCGDGELAHKPGLIVAISSGLGGAYPISELRSSSYKNTHIMWIPENIIIRNVEQFSPGNQGKDIPDWIEGRLDYSLELLLAYGKYMLPLRNQINRRDFGNGM
ncbi:NAD(P)H-dependent oxidoreductase [Alphaproteobacteria bacterium]|nr:NAD(P)H-dependent oxidoreductase [Alphaproteobacteria bacterium]